MIGLNIWLNRKTFVKHNISILNTTFFENLLKSKSLVLY